MSFSRISCPRRFGRRAVVRLAVDALSAESSRAAPVSDSGDAFISADPSTCEADAMTPLLAFLLVSLCSPACQRYRSSRSAPDSSQLMMTPATQTAPGDGQD